MACNTTFKAMEAIYRSIAPKLTFEIQDFNATNSDLPTQMRAIEATVTTCLTSVMTGTLDGE